jgi:polyketide biosynthesis enoyl-CoA hydratase PksH
MEFERISVVVQRDVCRVSLVAPDGNGDITAQLVSELEQILYDPRLVGKIVVLEGNEEVFCTGADLGAIVVYGKSRPPPPDPERLYRLWLQLSYGPFVTIAHIRGKTKAGGVGFVAACDISLSSSDATFCLSELLFGLLPACVMPFLERRVGGAKANYMTLMTMPFDAAKVCHWGLLDECADDSMELLRRHLLRLNHIPARAIVDYKAYLRDRDEPGLFANRTLSVEASNSAFSNPQNQELISRYLSLLEVDET